MTADLTLIEAERLGVRLFAKEGGRLGYDAPAGAMTQELKDALVANKAAIMDRLLSHPLPVPPAGPRPLPWRSIVGKWPIEARQRWGDRANVLQDSGLEWYEAERIAFEEVPERARDAPGPIAMRDSWG